MFLNNDLLCVLINDVMYVLNNDGMHVLRLLLKCFCWGFNNGDGAIIVGICTPLLPIALVYLHTL